MDRQTLTQLVRGAQITKRASCRCGIYHDASVSHGVVTSS